MFPRDEWRIFDLAKHLVRGWLKDDDSEYHHHALLCLNQASDNGPLKFN